MRKIFILFFGLLMVFPISAQDDFLIENDKRRVVIPFKLLNNLIFIPITVNGVELTFLLDSGVEETILFSMEDKKEVSFNNVQKIKLRGLGSEEEIEGLKSTNNVLQTHGLISTNHLVYIILDQGFNLSSQIGIPVNGIIGYRFFKNNIVEINYQKNKIFIYKDKMQLGKQFEKKFKTYPISIERSKPYIRTFAVVNDLKIPAKLLIDIGNSDSFWIFQNDRIALPEKNFPDFLGKGFSGDIEGHRAKISKFYLGDFEFENPIVAFPDSSSIKNVQLVPGRLGSVGGEVLKRFRIVLDYNEKNIYLKPNRKFHEPFTYNKSGITIQHNGLQWVQETVFLEMINTADKSELNAKERGRDFKYKFALKPVYEIVNIRSNSTGEKYGLQKGDVILSINFTKAYKYTLEQINHLFKGDKETWINLEIDRNGQILNFRLKLEEEL
jgi:hypothetical protein